MATRTIWNTSRASLATLPPTAGQSRVTQMVAAVVVMATASIFPFGAIQLAPMNGFIPATEVVLVVCDLLIAAFLASQAVTIGSRALLLLASGFLFDALIIVPHALTFPGAFGRSGLLHAGAQTTAWLYIFWHFGLPAAVIGYACLPRTRRALTAATLYRDATLVVGLVALLTWTATVYGNALPALFVDMKNFTPLANTVTGFDLFVSIVALLALLARRQKSILDLWLTVAVIALVAELTVVTFVIPSRFSLGWYTARLLSMFASITVLVAVLTETLQQGVRLARANLALQLERSSKMTTLDAALGAIVHELRQPISSIATNAEAAQMMLGSAAPDLRELREIAGEILDSSLRANKIFTNIRGLFRNSPGDLKQVDMNRLVSGVMRGLRADLREHGVVPRIELETDLPTVLGHEGQLQEVVFNLIHNALDAMKASSRTERTLYVSTEKRGRNAIGIAVQDSGPGIAPGQMEQIFDPFVTTKKDGMGLGLAICRMILERHGGQLSASTDIDIGARFQMTLPIKPAADVGRQLAEDAVAAADPQLSLRRPAFADTDQQKATVPDWRTVH
jgi:signal transduction histidine kinase